MGGEGRILSVSNASVIIGEYDGVVKKVATDGHAIFVDALIPYPFLSLLVP